jgi:hypothetical protein
MATSDSARRDVKTAGAIPGSAFSFTLDLDDYDDSQVNWLTALRVDKIPIATGVPVTLAYTAGAPALGVSFTLNAAYDEVTVHATEMATGDKLVIQAETPEERNTDYTSGSFYGSVVDADLNRLKNILLEHGRNMVRSIRLHTSQQTTVNMELPFPLVANKAVGINGAADGLSLLDFDLMTTSAAVIADNTLVRGDGGARGLQDTLITVDDADNLTTPASLNSATLVTTGNITSSGSVLATSGVGSFDSLNLVTNAFINGTIVLGGDISMSGVSTVDGRDVSVDGTKLDTIETSATADQTAGEILTAIKTVDGAGSGLDADLLDGLSSLAFVKEDGSVPLSANWDVGEFDILAKRLIGGGGDDTFPVTADIGLISENLGKPGQLYLKDLEVTKTFGSSDTDGTLLESNDGVFSIYGMSYSGTKGTVLFSLDQGTGDITLLAGATVDGRDVGVDGTKLDTIETSATADQTAGEILTAIKTVDGAASGLDADLLDGLQGAVYALLDGTRSFTGTVSIAAGGILIGEEARYDAQFALALTGAVSWDIATNPYAEITAPTGAITLTLTTNSLGSRPSLVFTQHGTTAQTLTVAVSGGTFAWEGGTAPDLTTLSSVFDMSFHCYDGTNVIGYWGKVGA